MITKGRGIEQFSGLAHRGQVSWTVTHNIGRYTEKSPKQLKAELPRALTWVFVLENGKD